MWGCSTKQRRARARGGRERRFPRVRRKRLFLTWNVKVRLDGVELPMPRVIFTYTLVAEEI